MDNREIERKFLVHVEKLPEQARGGGARFVQGYLSFKPSVRIRVSEGDAGEQAWITIKGPGTLSRAEFEYEIPASDARDMLSLCQATLTKVRRKVDVGAHTWEVDEFTGPHAGLWLAEVELEAEDDPFTRPEWLDREVSEDPRYTNGALARAGGIPQT